MSGAGFDADRIGCPHPTAGAAEPSDRRSTTAGRASAIGRMRSVAASGRGVVTLGWNIAPACHAAGGSTSSLLSHAAMVVVEAHLFGARPRGR